ncbi:PfkB family carbohydrate kinase [Ruania zhangjianzhongii]|uniref:PfkB family carbohydrate kinase n=1 Tax=Ruania zhangjianzhongii TaxID=2603206 RepID=UPI0011C7B6C8|nr:PfkB family carbohydrate kinase [Ruania zhangjianzhongii]
MTSAADVVFVGALTLDAIAVVDTFPEPDSRQVARDIVHTGGGPAATAAVAAARQGVRAALVGTVGEDAEGERILAELRAEGVDTHAVSVLPGQRSAASVVVVDASAGTRAIAARVAEPPVIGPQARALLAQARWVHADHLGARPLLAHLAMLPTQDRPGLSIDDGYGIDGFTPGGVDLYAPTVASLAQRYGDRPVPDLLAAARADGAHAVVATDGAQGAWFVADGTAEHLPAHRVDALSTLGAGDVFHGGLLAALAGHRPTDVTTTELAHAVSWASVVAALSCRGVDGRSAIPTPAEVLAARPELRPAHRAEEAR